MTTRPREQVWCLGFILTTGLTIACGSPGTLQPEVFPATTSADVVLYERGTEALSEDDWLRAREYFIQVRDNYPQSLLREQARLGVADTHFGEATIEGYVTALADYADFLQLYPTSERAPYAQYQLGMIHFHRMLGPDRDQSDTRDAIREFEAFIQRWPNADLMDEVRARLREARDRLSESELVVGRYYYNRKWTPGAVARLEQILETDPGFSGRDAVYFYLADTFRMQTRADEALTFFQRLMDEFPDSEFVEEAARIMPEVEATLAARREAEAAAAAAADSDDESDTDPDTEPSTDADTPSSPW